MFYFNTKTDDYVSSFFKSFNDVFNIHTNTSTGCTKDYVLENLDSSYELTLLVPGVSKDDIDVSYKKGEVTTIFIEIKNDSTFMTKCKRQFSFKDVDVKNLTAIIKDGVLKLSIQKEKSITESGKVTIQ